MSRLAIMPGRILWDLERKQAQALGCKLEVKTENGTAYARLTATTLNAQQAITQGAAETDSSGDSIEARQAYPEPADVADAMHAAITSVLTLGRDILQ